MKSCLYSITFLPFPLQLLLSDWITHSEKEKIIEDMYVRKITDVITYPAVICIWTSDDSTLSHSWCIYCKLSFLQCHIFYFPFLFKPYPYKWLHSTCVGWTAYLITCFKINQFPNCWGRLILFTATIRAALLTKCNRWDRSNQIRCWISKHYEMAPSLNPYKHWTGLATSNLTSFSCYVINSGLMCLKNKVCTIKLKKRFEKKKVKKQTNKTHKPPLSGLQSAAWCNECYILR